MVNSTKIPLTLAVIIVLVLIGANGYQYYWASQALSISNQKLASTTVDFNLKIIALEADLASTTADRDRIFEELTAEQKETLALERQVERTEDKVDELEKIIETDKELLQKYSKVYFLNEHYTPSRLRDIPTEMLNPLAKPQQIHYKVWPKLRDMIEDAEDDDIDLKVVSAYRSFETQVGLKTGYKTIYGSGANAFSADQGYSEHQLGTTVDLNTPGTVATSLAFANTPAYKWLTENAYKYGFVLSYPKGNAYYMYEPWHWRFVGENLADDLHDDGKNFYDMDQRDIDKYLGEIFD